MPVRLNSLAIFLSIIVSTVSALGEKKKVKVRPKRRRWMKFLILFLVVFMLGPLAYIGYAHYEPKVRFIYDQSQLGKEKLESAQIAFLEEKDFTQVSSDLQAASSHFASAQETLKEFEPYKDWPYVDKQYQALDQIYVVTQDTITVLSELNDILRYIDVRDNDSESQPYTIYVAPILTEPPTDAGPQ